MNWLPVGLCLSVLIDCKPGETEKPRPECGKNQESYFYQRRLDSVAHLFCLRVVERKKAAVKRSEEQLLKLEVQATDREENKQIALGTSKLNYLDPRISVAW